jgi:hypothetical protein
MRSFLIRAALLAALCWFAYSATLDNVRSPIARINSALRSPAPTTAPRMRQPRFPQHFFPDGTVGMDSVVRTDADDDLATYLLGE